MGGTGHDGPQLMRKSLGCTDELPEVTVNAWEIVVLAGFHSLGGEADLQALYRFLKNDTPLPQQHLRSTRYGGRPAYQHQVRSHVSHLCKSGDLRRGPLRNYSAWSHSTSTHGRRLACLTQRGAEPTHATSGRSGGAPLGRVPPIVPLRKRRFARRIIARSRRASR